MLEPARLLKPFYYRAPKLSTSVAVETERINCDHVTLHSLKMVFTVLFAIYIVLLAFPSPPTAITSGLDSSYMLALNMAHAQKLVAGQNLHWTYGPLAYLSMPDPISSEKSLALIFGFVFYLIWIGALARLIVISESKLLALWTGMLLAASGFLAGQWSSERLELAIITVALLPLVKRTRFRYLELAILAALAGTALLLKINWGIQYGLLFLAVFAYTVWRDHPLTLREMVRATLVLLTFPCSAMLLYAAATGKISTFWSFLRYSLELVGGYSENMSFSGPLWQLELALMSFAGLFIVVPSVAERPRKLMPGLIISSILAFLFFKHSFVRQDAHVVSFEIKLAIASLFVIVFAVTARDKRLVFWYQAFCCALWLVFLLGMIPVGKAALRRDIELRDFASSARSYLHWNSTWKRLERQRDANLAPLHLDESFHNIIGNDSVDAIPYNIEQVQANGWKWQPAPIFQMYVAETPTLDRMNAAHYGSDKAAKFLLLNWFAVDGRHPLADAPASWRALLNWYNLRYRASEVALLERRSEPRFRQLQHLGSTTARWDEQVLIPQDDELLVMSVQADKSLYGDLRNLLYRLEPVTMEVTYQSGLNQTWRVVRANLADGIIINDLPRNLTEMEHLFSSRTNPDHVISARFHAEGRQEYTPLLRINWYRLPLRSGQARNPQWPPPGKLAPVWRPGQALSACLNAHCTSGPSGLSVSPETGDPQLYFDAGNALRNSQGIVVRARFPVIDRIDLFFGKQIDGRGLNGIIPLVNQWQDVYIYTAHNPFWKMEHGFSIRFDPVSELGIDTHVEIAGVWAFYGRIPDGADDIEFYPLPDKRIRSR